MVANFVNQRPRLRLKARLLERVIDAVALIAIALTIGVVVWKWPSLPNRIAHHFDFAGKPDAWGGRWVLLFLPAVSIAMYILLTAVSRVPHRFNYAWEINEQNAERQYRIARSMLSMLKAEIAIMFFFITWAMIRSAQENSASLGKGFLPLVIGAICVTAMVHLVLAYRAR